MKRSFFFAVVIVIIYQAVFCGGVAYGVKTQSQWQDNQYVVEKYIRDLNQGVIYPSVIVGSSVSRLLEFPNQSNLVYNLALSGDSALTGIQVIKKLPVFPKVVFMEINFPDRGVNDRLLDSSFGFMGKLSPLFYTENKPFNKILTYVYRYLDGGRTVKNIDSELYRKAVIRQVREWQFEIPADVMRRNMGDIFDSLMFLKSRGVKIVLFEMPVDQEVQKTPRVLQVRRTFNEMFPEENIIQFNDLVDSRGFRTRDGIHLQKGDATIVATALFSRM